MKFNRSEKDVDQLEDTFTPIINQREHNTKHLEFPFSWSIMQSNFWIESDSQFRTYGHAAEDLERFIKEKSNTVF